MKVGVLCEFSGVVRDAFIREGHDAVSYDLLPSENPGPHVQRDIMDFNREYWKQYDMLICFPPYTHLQSQGPDGSNIKRKSRRKPLSL